MERQEFDKWFDQFVEATTPRRPPVSQQYAGPSILELINNERLLAAGDYRLGLDHGLYTIDKANSEGRKPFYALKSAWAQACADKKSAEFRRGIETVQFIFNNPYKWIAGERH